MFIKIMYVHVHISWVLASMKTCTYDNVSIVALTLEEVVPLVSMVKRKSKCVTDL